MDKNINYFKQKGDTYIFSAGMGLLLSLGMVAWIVVIILSKSLGFFWPADMIQITTTNGNTYLGELWAEKSASTVDSDGNKVEDVQLQLKIGNRDLFGRDFVWVRTADILETTSPEAVTTFERLEYGNFYGKIVSVRTGTESYSESDADLLEQSKVAHELAIITNNEIKDTQEKITTLTEPLTRLQRELYLQKNTQGRGDATTIAAMEQQAFELESSIADEFQQLNAELEQLLVKERGIVAVVRTAEGKEKELHLAEVVRFFQPNEMGVFAKSWHYAGKLREFFWDDPRESNTEGGVFPAVFGTVMMVLLMSIAVVPFGVMAAVYLNEYAKQGAIIRFIRLSVNNLAGVPSIVFGVFGLGFFVYVMGGSIDQLFFAEKLPEPTFGTGGILWASLTLALLTLPVVVVATEEGLLAVPRANKEGALALGATRWQMIRRVVLPNAMPGILTGLILAVSRGAGEVAPLMITGVVKLAPSLPLDSVFPFLHLDRKFMHLGFHIYDVGFQSPNVEAAKPMVYNTALLLIVLVILLNLIAIYFRNRLRKRYKSATF